MSGEIPSFSEPIPFKPRQSAEMTQSLESCQRYCVLAKRMLGGKIPLQHCQMALLEQGCERAYTRLMNERIRNNPDIIDGR